MKNTTKYTQHVLSCAFAETQGRKDASTLYSLSTDSQSIYESLNLFFNFVVPNKIEPLQILYVNNHWNSRYMQTKDLYVFTDKVAILTDTLIACRKGPLEKNMSYTTPVFYSLT